MAMGVSVVTYPVDPQQADELHRRVRDHLVPAAQQVPGYRGFLLVDQGDNKRLAMLLFDSVEAAQAAQEVLTPVGREQTYGLMTGPAVGALGTVLIADGVFGQTATPQQTDDAAGRATKGITFVGGAFSWRVVAKRIDIKSDRLPVCEMPRMALHEPEPSPAPVKKP